MLQGFGKFIRTTSKTHEFQSGSKKQRFFMTRSIKEQLHDLVLTEAKATKLWMVIKRRPFKRETSKGIENLKLRVEKADITKEIKIVDKVIT